MGPTWGPPGSCRPPIGPMLAPWTLLSGYRSWFSDIRVANFTEEYEDGGDENAANANAQTVLPEEKDEKLGSYQSSIPEERENDSLSTSSTVLNVIGPDEEPVSPPISYSEPIDRPNPNQSKWKGHGIAGYIEWCHPTNGSNTGDIHFIQIGTVACFNSIVHISCCCVHENVLWSMDWLERLLMSPSEVAASWLPARRVSRFLWQPPDEYSCIDT